MTSQLIQRGLCMCVHMNKQAEFRYQTDLGNVISNTLCWERFACALTRPPWIVNTWEVWNLSLFGAELLSRGEEENCGELSLGSIRLAHISKRGHQELKLERPSRVRHWMNVPVAANELTLPLKTAESHDERGFHDHSYHRYEHLWLVSSPAV